ncbi:hypothetical protein M3J09_009126 [Ascochyta lentis]
MTRPRTTPFHDTMRFDFTLPDDGDWNVKSLVPGRENTSTLFKSSGKCSEKESARNHRSPSAAWTRIQALRPTILGTKMHHTHGNIQASCVGGITRQASPHAADGGPGDVAGFPSQFEFGPRMMDTKSGPPLSQASAQ